MTHLPGNLQIHTITWEPVGYIWVASSENGVFALTFGQRGISRFKRYAEEKRMQLSANDHPNDAVEQLGAYFAGEYFDFDLAIDYSWTTAFQYDVYQACLAIPVGQTRSYGALAQEVGQPDASRAVGRAMGDNQIPIIIPCHRVVNASGDLHGYSAAGGINTKRLLLRHEGYPVQELLL